MDEILWTTPLYGFIRQCNETPLEKTVLDCGAGCDRERAPPLFLFYQQGYKTYGIEIGDDALAGAIAFIKEKNVPLDIIRGDMRRIPFGNEAFSFVYSFNAISFMTKPDIEQAMHEMERVLRPNGLCFVNFDSVDDPDRRPFRKNGFTRRLLRSKRFSQYRDNEADKYFNNFEILRKEKRLIEKLFSGERIKQAYIDYIARKR